MLPSITTQFAGHEITALAAEHGTPFYAYDAAKIAERVNDLAPFDTIRYAQKACSNLAVLDRVRRQGVLVDAVSRGEIARALAAGYAPTGDPPPIVYTADLFDREALDRVVELDLAVNCGSPDMIDQYGERCRALQRERGITLRINPGFGHGHSQKVNTGGEGSKHGIWHAEAAASAERAAQYGLTVSGLHMHIGSGTDMEHLAQVSQAMQRIALEVGPSIRSISAGGGLSTPYRETDEPVDVAAYYRQWDSTRQQLAQTWGHPVALEIEPGRYLTAEAGILVAEVRAVKQMGSRHYCLVDAGFNNLARPVLYGAYHPIGLCPAPGTSTDRPSVDTVVGGPLCESGDIFTQSEGGVVESRPLPAAEVGDLLVIGAAGAYGFVMGSNYNSKPLAAEVLLEGDAAHLVRRRQQEATLFADEQIPPPRGA